MKKSAIIIVIVFMMIGFAAVSTSLIINSNIKVSENETDFDVYFSKARLDTIDVYESVISQDKKTITFNTNNLSKVGDKSVLTYEVTNNSNNYDAKVKVTCTPENNKYTSITNTIDVEDNIVPARNTAKGRVTITLNKTSLEEVSEEYTCKLEFNAVERDTVGVSGTNLYNLIKFDADTETVIDYKVRSGVSGTNGIYKTTATDGNVPVYYYRGDADKVNNNIIFNNMCWKIIRTTENNGVKIIYNGTPTNGKCETQTGETTQIGTSAFNEKYNDNAYVGYMYGTAGSNNYTATHENKNDSTIKTYIENWYSQNFGESTTSKLEDTVFCNDRSTKAYDANTIGNSILSSYTDLGYGTSVTFYGEAHRASWYASNPNPSLMCAQDNDKFTVDSKNGNGKLTYPVGLITLDEVIFAGFNTRYSDVNEHDDITNYLYTNSSYWTFSPILVNDRGNAHVGDIGDSGAVGDADVNSIYGVRPVISLASGTLVTGSGTTTNPYVVL